MKADSAMQMGGMVRAGRLRELICAASFCLILLLPAATGSREQACAQTFRQVGERKSVLSVEARERVRRVVPAVGLVLVRNLNDAAPDPRPRGSAVIVHKDGIVVTNHHVIANERTSLVYDELYLYLPQGNANSSKDHRYRLRPVMIEKEHDLALLRIVADTSDKAENETAEFPVMEFGDAGKLELLDDLIIIGFPEKGGTTVTVNPGVVEGRDDAEEWIKTDARLIHGNSGGAAVNPDGKLIGIPTRVVVDGDAARTYGAVGFLRPVHLVAAMLERLRELEQKVPVANTAAAVAAVNTDQTGPDAAPGMIRVSGIVRSVIDDKPIAGVRVGLLPVGQEVTASSLLAWGGSNASGQFELGRSVPPGRYSLRAKVIGYEAYSQDVDIDYQSGPLLIRLKPSAP